MIEISCELLSDFSTFKTVITTDIDILNVPTLL